jgi:hypothetical protein
MAATLNTPTDPDSPSRPGLLAVEPDVLLARDMSHALLLMLEKLMPQSGGPYHNFVFDTIDIAALHRAAGMAADAAAAAAEQLYQGLENDRVGTP